jgi:SAM-dependent methyltransferase
VNATIAQPTADIQTIKARQKATWESGDFGQVAKFITPIAEQFMSRIELRPGTNVLDAACGTGNLAVIAARRGCVTSGLDLASNLVAQARERARQESLSIDFTQGDAEAMPYPDASFDGVVSMYGVMFAPRPERVVSELVRVTKPGGFIALANWTPDGFIGKMFAIFSRHLPPPPGLPSPLWGNEETVRARFNGDGHELRLTRHRLRGCVFRSTRPARWTFSAAFTARPNEPLNRCKATARPPCCATLSNSNQNTTFRHARTKPTRHRNIWKSTRASRRAMEASKP